MRIRILLGGLAILGLTFGMTTPSFATINPNIEVVNQSVGIAVSPFGSDRLVLNQGDVVDGRFRVRQTGQETNEVYIHIRPMSIRAGSTANERDFYTEKARTQIVNWISIGDIEGCSVNKVEDGKTYFTMRSQEECYVNYTITVPHNAVGGSQNAALTVRSVEKRGEDGGVGLRNSYSFAYLLHSNVNGPDALYQGKVLENNIPWILFNPPLAVDTLVENTGNLDFDVKYDVAMRDYFGGKEVYDRSWDTIAYAETQRADETAWEGAPALGLFQVTQEVELLDETSSKTQLVLLIPIWLILIILGVVILLTWAIVLRAKQRKN